MGIVIGILKVVFGFAVVIGIHEFGHGITARLLGIPVKEFSIGMGPGWTIWERSPLGRVRISPIVIGGYVRIEEEALFNAPLWKRVLVYLAGMVMNLLLAATLLLASGLSLLESLTFSFGTWVTGWPMFFSGLSKKMFAAHEVLVGPIGIGQALATGVVPGDAHTHIPYLVMLALININIALLNLFPLPPLDGGNMALTILQSLIGRGRAQAVGRVAGLVGVVALLLVIVLAFKYDMMRMFSTHP